MTRIIPLFGLVRTQLVMKGKRLTIADFLKQFTFKPDGKMESDGLVQISN